MTAIGFGLLFIALALDFLEDFLTYPEWLIKLIGAAYVVGGVLTALGISVWLWRAMP